MLLKRLRYTEDHHLEHSLPPRCKTERTRVMSQRAANGGWDGWWWGQLFLGTTRFCPFFGATLCFPGFRPKSAQPKNGRPTTNHPIPHLTSSESLQLLNVLRRGRGIRTGPDSLLEPRVFSTPLRASKLAP